LIFGFGVVGGEIDVIRLSNALKGIAQAVSRILKLLLINVHAGGREIQPDDLGGQPLEARGAFVVPVAEMIAVLNPFAAVRQNRADFYTNTVRSGVYLINWWDKWHRNVRPGCRKIDL